MAPRIERVKVADIYPLVDEYGNEFVSRDYGLQVNKDYVEQLAESFGPGGEPDEHVKLVRDGEVFRIKAGNSRVRAMQLLGTDECWAVIDDDDTVQGVVETVVRTNVKKKYEPVEESRFVQQLVMFGDDEYVGGVACIEAERAAKIRRGREIARTRAEQMSLEHLAAICDFDDYDEWAAELAECDEGDWRQVANRLYRQKESHEDTVAFETEARRLKIELVDTRPDRLHYICCCTEPDELSGAYMAASVDYKSIVGKLDSTWRGIEVDLYGEPLHEEAEAAAAAEKRRLAESYEASAAAVDDAVFEWMRDRFMEVYDGELPGDFRVLGQRCWDVAMRQWWVKDTLREFKGIDPEEDCIFLFLLGYKSARTTLVSYARILAEADPRTHPLADRMRKALEWARLHEEDGWEPDDGMAAFLAEARAALAEEGGE